MRTAPSRSPVERSGSALDKRSMLLDHVADLNASVNSAAEANQPQVICFPFAGGVAGGSHVSACKLIQALDRSLYQPLVLLHHDCGEVARLFRSEGVAYRLAPTSHHFGRAPGVERPGRAARSARALAGQRTLASFLRREKVRLVHTNDGAMHVTWSLPAKIAGIPLLWHHRSDPSARGVRYIAPISASQVVSVSRFAISRSPRLQRFGRAAVIYSPFDTDPKPLDRAAARADIITELALAPNTRILSFFGNFYDRKRPFLFVEVIARLRQIAPQLPIAGLMFGSALDASTEGELQRRAEALGIAGELSLMGFRYPPERWMAGSDLHLVTAVDEPFGRSLIEAMLLGTPVVATRSGGNIEAIDHGRTGLLTTPDDPNAMAREVLSLLEQPHRMTEIASEARTQATIRFGVKRHAEAIEALYRSLISSGE